MTDPTPTQIDDGGAAFSFRVAEDESVEVHIPDETWRKLYKAFAMSRLARPLTTTRDATRYDSNGRAISRNCTPKEWASYLGDVADAMLGEGSTPNANK